jgi:type IV secretory pathway TrbD component
MTQVKEHIEGYDAPIHRGVWEPILTMGAPRIWSAVWLVGCLYAALMIMTACGLRWMLLPLGAWPIGQGMLVVLTQWDSFWVDLLGAHMVRRYRTFYDAG